MSRAKSRVTTTEEITPCALAGARQTDGTPVLCHGFGRAKGSRTLSPHPHDGGLKVGTLFGGHAGATEVSA
jgi:hypothetical protein